MLRLTKASDLSGGLMKSVIYTLMARGPLSALLILFAAFVAAHAIAYALLAVPRSSPPPYDPEPCVQSAMGDVPCGP